jgi:hypothetical protein
MPQIHSQRQTNKQTDPQTNKTTNERTDKQTNKQVIVALVQGTEVIYCNYQAVMSWCDQAQQCQSEDVSALTIVMHPFGL